MKRNILPLIISIFLFGYHDCIAQSTIYVDQAATGANNGSSWTDAYSDFQSALDAALSGDVINVGVGTYYPSKDITGSSTPADPRSVTFYFDVDVEVHGGFVGGVQLCDTNNATVFSGDIGILNDASDNVYNVCYSEYLSNSTIIDCITITRGAAETATLSGAGWYNDGTGAGNSSNPNFINCYFNNNAAGQGGAIINLGSNGGNASPTITNCIFLKNISEQGGAIFNNGENGTSSPTILQSQFIDNYSGEGGAIYNYAELNGVSKPTVSNTLFTANEVYGDGGAVYIYGDFGDGEAIFNNCTFSANKADGNGGAMSISTFGTTFSSPQVNNCTFIGNLASFNAGAVFCMVSSPTIDGCTFEQNQCASSGGAIFMNGSQGQVSSPNVLNSTFRSNTSALRGGAAMLDGLAGTCNPTFVSCKFIQNESTDGGAVYADGTIGICQPEFINTIFSRNYATNDGGGLYFNSNSGTTEPRFEHCSLSKNQAQAGGLGTIMAFFGSNNGICQGTIYNSVSHGQNGIGIYITGFNASFTGFNTMHENGWSNLWSFTNGGGCVVASPLYNDPLNDDLTLQSISPAIDGGLAANTTVTTDHNGNARIIGAHPDMGAYENDPCPVKLFVDIDAVGANSGLDWTNAFNSLQDAIDLARSCQVDTIWVAEGTYKPSKTKAGSAANPNSKDNVFYVDFDVVIQGGFQGFETNELQRDWIAYETILDGNIGALGTNADNCYTVVEYANCTNVSQMDGFTVRGGNSNSWQGSAGHGGGFVIYSSPIIRNCKVTGNYGYNGGAMAINNFSGNANPAVLHCEIVNNTGGVSAGIIVNAYGGNLTPTIANCDFSGNSGINGGAWAFYAYNGGANCQPKVYNCKVWNNSAQLGAVMLLRDAEATITNCSFGNNVGSQGKFYNGYNGTRTSTIENCILWNPGGGLEIQNVVGTPFIVNNSIVRGGYGNGTGITTTDPLYINAATGDLRLNSASPAINSGINTLMHIDAYDVDYDGNITEIVDIDLDGTLRVQNTTIDLGAFEFGGTLDEEEIEKTVVSKVYPNPFGSGTKLAIERESDESIALTVFNALGQIVLRSETSGSTTILDTSDWLPGVYLIRIGEETLRAVKSN